MKYAASICSHDFSRTTQRNILVFVEASSEDEAVGKAHRVATLLLPAAEGYTVAGIQVAPFDLDAVDPSELEHLSPRDRRRVVGWNP